MTDIFYKIGEFDYTLDVLIADIRQNKVSIYDIPITEITEKFLSILAELEKKLDTEDLTYFYRMTAELLYLKIAALLPRRIDLSEEDEERLLRGNVINVLEKLKFSKYSALLKKYRDDHSVSFMRDALPFRLPFTDEDLLRDIRLNDLCRVYTELLNRVPEGIDLPLNTHVSSSEKRALMLELFETKDRILFTELIVHLDSRDHIIAAFVAILEAAYDGMCVISQEKIYMDIYIDKVAQGEIDSRTADEIDERYDDLQREALEKKLEDEDNFDIIDP